MRSRLVGDLGSRSRGLPSKATTIRLAMCYCLQCALQAATAALAAAGYRATRDNHHYRVIQSLEFTIAPGRKFVDTLDGFRKKRNVSSYDVAGTVSDKEASEIFKLATSLRIDVEKWIRATHPGLFTSG